MSRVTIMGAGAMGSRMASCLLKAGHDVTVWNRDAGKLSTLQERGAKSAASPRAAVSDAEYVISMVRDDEASRSVWLAEKNGALAGMPKKAVAVECSTLTVDWIKGLAAHCHKREIAFLDAPVAGSRPQAEAAQLIFMVGGDAGVFDKAEPLLLNMGAKALYIGPAGSGATVKLMVNALFGIQLATMGELIGFARRSGIDEARAIEILAATPAFSPAAKVASEAILKGNFIPMFPIELVVKDFAYVMQTAASNGAAMPLSESARNVFNKALEKGYAQDNITGVAQLYL